MLLRLPDPASRARAHADGTGPADRPEVERALAVRFVGCFEGWSLVTLSCDHRPYWLLSEIANALGVEDPTQLLTALAERWLGDCPPEAIVSLDGGNRRELLEKLDRAHVVLARERARKPITLLGPAAIDELCARFDSAVARRLRAHLRDTGRHDTTRQCCRQGHGLRLNRHHRHLRRRWGSLRMRVG